VLKQMFPTQFNSPEWQTRIHQIVPSYGQKLNGNVALTQQVWDDTAATLQLTKPPVIQMPAAAPPRPRSRLSLSATPRRSMIWRCKSKLESEQKGRPRSSLFASIPRLRRALPATLPS
jgi:hypothetical protein